MKPPRRQPHGLFVVNLWRMSRAIESRVLLLVLPICSLAQSGESLDWFPSKTGDMWEYRFWDGIIVDTSQIINISDSVSTDGKIHLTQIRRFINPIDHNPYLDSLNYTIDTATGEVFGRLPAFEELRNVLVYKFDVEPGDQWVMDTLGGYEIARVTDIYDGVLFEMNTTFIQMHYYGAAADSADTAGLDRYWATLAKGFGLVDIFIAEGAWQYVIKGAVINGVLYGDTTQVLATGEDVSGHVIPRVAKLHQNYPNPFNVSTTIRFDLDISQNVSLTIYDLQGREVRRLINARWLSPVTHMAIWDGTTNGGADAPSGVYTYRLKTGRYRLSRSMILVK